MKNVNKKLKTESDIRIFKDCDSTVGELCNPKDIGVIDNGLLNDLLLVTVDCTELLLTENRSNCSIFIVLNSQHDAVNINIHHH
jgi:hypothetical protein